MDPNHNTHMQSVPILNTKILRKAYRRVAKIKGNRFSNFGDYIVDLRVHVEKVGKLLTFRTNYQLEENVDFHQALQKTINCLQKHIDSMESIANQVANHTSTAQIKKDLSNMQHLQQQRAEVDRCFDIMDDKKVRILSITRYYVVLVTTPPVHFHGFLSDRTSLPDDQPEPIDWLSKNREEIPLLEQSLHFRRHFALCLVEKNLWESQSMLGEKLLDAPFWEIPDWKSPTPGRLWDPERVATINGIKELGITASDSPAATQLCTKYYFRLRRRWKYYRIWWNDGDFALCLAYLLVNRAARPTCQAIWHRRYKLRTRFIRTRGRRFRDATRSFIGPGLVTLVAHTIGMDEMSSRNVEIRRNERMRLIEAYPELEDLLTE